MEKAMKEAKRLLKADEDYHHPGLVVAACKDEAKGKGVFNSGKTIPAGTFVSQYGGVYVRQRDCVNVDKSNYVFFMSNRFVWDATDPEACGKCIGRWINHSRLHANLRVASVTLKGRKHVIFITQTDIEPGHELVYDYGDRRSSGLEWLLHS